MIESIIFDWSGVIKDSVISHLQVINKIFKEFNREEITLSELTENWQQPYMNFYKKYLPEIGFEEEQAAYKRAISDLPGSISFEGIVSLIKKFKENGTKMSVVSSDLPETLLPEINHFGLEGIFDEVITNAHNKEDGVKKIIDELHYILEKTAIIGDSNHEIEVGKKYNIKTIGVTWGFSSEEKLKSANPDFIVHNLEELEQIILNK